MNALELTGRAQTHLTALDGTGCRMHREAVGAFLAMRAAAEREGIALDAASAFRDFDRQRQLWNAKFRGERAFGPLIPNQLRRLLDSRPETRSARFEVAMPEHRIRFDRHGGEPRNADMALVGRTDAGKIAITIEAKADEPFGATVAETFSNALERLIENPRSRGVRRIEDLAHALFAARPKRRPSSP